MSPNGEGNKLQTIDMTPTWEGILPVLITLIENGNATGRATAVDELRKMAKLADELVRREKSQPGG